jgi:hypothetical protein
MGIREEVRRLRRRAEREALVIPQLNGPPAKFPRSVLQDVFAHNMRRLAGEDLAPHPVSLAVASSPEPNRYAGTFLDGEHLVVDLDGEPIEEELEDLSGS